jgi:type IV pilus assembly protein PilA
MLNPVPRNLGFTLVELMIVVAIIGILAALAVPNFIKFQARAKQAEAKTSLRAYFTAEKHFYSEADSFTANLGALAFSPERGNRYSYRSHLAPTAWSARSTASIINAPQYDAVEVDCFKIGGGCTSQPTRAGTMAAFTVTFDQTATGPSDTGLVTGPNGGYVMEASGTVDNDTDNDVWLVSSGTITVSGGPCSDAENGVPSIPVCIYNDVACP